MIYLRNDILKESRRLRCAKINHSRAILARIWIALTSRGFGGGSVKINRTILRADGDEKSLLLLCGRFELISARVRLPFLPLFFHKAMYKPERTVL